MKELKWLGLWRKKNNGRQIDRSMQIYSTYRQALNEIVTDL